MGLQGEFRVRYGTVSGHLKADRPHAALRVSLATGGAGQWHKVSQPGACSNMTG